MKISYYPNFRTPPAGKIELIDFLEDVRSERWQDIVFKVRSEKDPAKRKALKEKAAGVTASAVFGKERKKDAVISHSGFLAIDIDDKENPALSVEGSAEREQLKAALAADPFAYAVHDSIGGRGLVMYIKINGNKHLDAFLAVEKYLADEYQVSIDAACKDVTRFRFISWDSNFEINTKAKRWTTYLTKKQKVPVNWTPIFHDDDLDFIVGQIKEKGVDITASYSDWLQCAFGLADELDEGGREYFHAISSNNPNYSRKETDRLFDVSLRRKGNNGGVTIKSFFFHCINSGLEIKTEETKKAERLAKQQIKQCDNRTEALHKARQLCVGMEGMTVERVDPILEQLKDIPKSQIKLEKTDDDFEELALFVRSQGLRFNEVTRNLELDGEIVNDRIANSIYVQAMKSIGFDVSRQKLDAVMYSEEVPKYNPFLEFFQKNASVKSEGHIKELLDCIEIEDFDLTDTQLTEDERIADYLDVFVRRWLLSIISSMHGVYSLLVLVLSGHQGTGKSKFFRGLLPEDLLPYYGESKLDGGKDDDILMCKKLLILDDEFSGKSKREAHKFKEISSKQTFNIRAPYGRISEDLNRYAVLCGTTNEKEILNDMTGNRRLIPVIVKSIDWERYEAIDKTALFMELYREYKEVKDGWMLSAELIEYLAKMTTASERECVEEGFVNLFFMPADKGMPRAKFMRIIEITDYLDSRASGRGMNYYNIPLALQKNGFKKVRSRGRGHKNAVWGYWVLPLFDVENPQFPV